MTRRNSKKNKHLFKILNQNKLYERKDEHGRIRSQEDPEFAQKDRDLLSATRVMALKMS